MSKEAFNKFCFTADITPSTEHLDIWKAACDYQREMDAKICEHFGNDGYGYLPAAAIRANKGGIA